ncbi:MAG: AtpZ/AtpI family protein [Candidatus Izimaplasma sp.]|nr:AtpZ/AtpI family protein [Candidatus Izimaplasma bacterium]
MNEKQKNAFRVYSVVSSFLFEIIITIGISIAIGYFLDEWLNTVFVFKLIFIIIGVFAGIRNLIVKVSRLEDQDGE